MAYCFIAIFVAMIGYIVYFQVFKAEDIINNSYNKRHELFASRMIRGDIVSAEGDVLATTKVSESGKETRYYPHGNMYAHAVGYCENGTTGVEEQANFSLLRTHSFIGNQIYNMLTEKKNKGDTVVTTLKSKLQSVAYNALGSFNGAVVAIDPSNGRILAMVSKPDFDPNDVKEGYEDIISNDSVLLNRATQGSYTPGSTFKIFTTLEYLKEHGSDAAYTYNCTGQISMDGTTVHCYGNEVHGQLDLEHAFAESCNCAYANMGLNLNISEFQKMTKKMLFNSALPIEYPYTKSSFSLSKDSSTASIMMGSFGQDQITVSPMHLAMVAAAIENNGMLMKPYVIDHVENDAGDIVTETEREEYRNLLSKNNAKVMQKLMEATVNYGTATALQSSKYKAAGKTGSAQVSDSSDDTHSWFVGYANRSSGKDLAIAVIVEKQGNGSRYAVPIAKKVFDAYFD